MMLERFGNHLQQHLRTQKTHFSNLHWGMLKCWCSAVQTARCQPTSEKCWGFFNVLFLHFEENGVKMPWCQGTSLHKPACCMRAGRHPGLQSSAFNRDATTALRKLRISVEKSSVLLCLTRSRAAASPLSKITHYHYFCMDCRTNCSFLYVRISLAA